MKINIKNKISKIEIGDLVTVNNNDIAMLCVIDDNYILVNLKDGQAEDTKESNLDKLIVSHNLSLLEKSEKLILSKNGGYSYDF